MILTDRKRLACLTWLAWLGAASLAAAPAAASPSADRAGDAAPAGGGVMIGAFTGTATVESYEAKIGRTLAQVLQFCDFDADFPLYQARALWNQGKVLQITWELYHRGTSNTAASAPVLDEVLSGTLDARIDAWAAAVREFGQPVLIRFLHEFNGNWYVWGGPKNGAGSGGPDKVKRTWMYVVGRFRAAGATNAQWVWCPHGPTGDVPTAAWNDLSAYWPGAEWVDWLGMDGYNWYPDDPWGGKRPWQSFDMAFGPLYGQLVALGPGKPVCVSETACGESDATGEAKAGWIRDAFARMKAAYPAIRLYSWFHINKEKDWRVDSRPAALAAFRAAMADPWFGSVWKDPR